MSLLHRALLKQLELPLTIARELNMKKMDRDYVQHGSKKEIDV